MHTIKSKLQRLRSHKKGAVPVFNAGYNGDKAMLQRPNSYPPDHASPTNMTFKSRPRKFKHKSFSLLLEKIRMQNSGASGCVDEKNSVSCDSNQVLHSLDVSGKHLDQFAAEELAAVLSDDVFITDLNISNNTIGDTGLLYISIMLTKNKTLKRLDIRNNNLTKNGIKQLLFCLERSNLSLKELHVEDKDHMTNRSLFFEDMDDGSPSAQQQLLTTELVHRINCVLESNRSLSKVKKGTGIQLKLSARGHSFSLLQVFESFQNLEVQLPFFLPSYPCSPLKSYH